MRYGRLSNVFLALVLSVNVYAGNQDLDKRTTAMTEQAQQWTNSTECFGRYQISLPQNHGGGTGWQIGYGRWGLKAYPRNWKGDDTRRDALEAIGETRNSGRDGTQLYVTDRVIKAGRSFLYVTKDKYAEVLPNYEKTDREYADELKARLAQKGLKYTSTFILFTEKMTYWISGSPFWVKYINGKPQPNAGIIDSEINRLQKRFENELLNKMRELELNEIPVGPGICMNSSFIPDDGKVPFEAKSTFKLNDHPNTYFSVTVNNYSPTPAGTPLLERKVQKTDSSLLDLLANLKYGTVRQGKRAINEVAGSEKLVKWDGNRYLFRWESDDRALIAEMDSGAENKGGSTLSQEEAIRIWDSILPTLRKRGG